MIYFLILIGAAFGFYDFLIKLSSGKISPLIGPVICQFFSALSATVIMGFVLVYWKNAKLTSISSRGLILSALAGIMITLALFGLFYYLQNSQAKISSTLPIVLILRNIILVLLGVIVLKEDFGIFKIIGLIFSFGGIYLIAK